MSREILHRFGEIIGVKASWCQGPRKEFPGERRLVHFDLTEGMRKRALAHGALDLNRRAAVDVMRRVTGRPPISELLKRIS